MADERVVHRGPRGWKGPGATAETVETGCLVGDRQATMAPHRTSWMQEIPTLSGCSSKPRLKFSLPGEQIWQGLEQTQITAHLLVGRSSEYPAAACWMSCDLLNPNSHVAPSDPSSQKTHHSQPQESRPRALGSDHSFPIAHKPDTENV